MTGRDTSPTQTFRVIAKPESCSLPTYNGLINDNTSFSSVLIDPGATTQYISQTTAKQLGMKIHPCAPRFVSVADEHKITVKAIVSFELKLEGLPKEKITAYTFPLSSLDLILGLPWLKRYNSLTDWQKGTHEFTINGRRFLLHPKTPPDPPRKKLPPDKLALCNLQEFREFVDDSAAQIFIIDFKSLKPKDESRSAPPALSEEEPLKLPR
jgi:gag-polyprotein putative aspartyl protease